MASAFQLHKAASNREGRVLLPQFQRSPPSTFVNNNTLLLIIPSLKSVLNAQLNCFSGKVSVKVKKDKEKQIRRKKKQWLRNLSVSASAANIQSRRNKRAESHLMLYRCFVLLSLIRPDGSLINGQPAGNLLLLSVLSSIMTNSRTSCNFL